MDPWVASITKDNSGVFPNTHDVPLYPEGQFMAKSAIKADKAQAHLMPEFYFKE